MFYNVEEFKKACRDMTSLITMYAVNNDLDTSSRIFASYNPETDKMELLDVREGKVIEVDSIDILNSIDEYFRKMHDTYMKVKALLDGKKMPEAKEPVKKTPVEEPAIKAEKKDEKAYTPRVKPSDLISEGERPEKKESKESHSSEAKEVKKPVSEVSDEEDGYTDPVSVTKDTSEDEDEIALKLVAKLFDESVSEEEDDVDEEDMPDIRDDEEDEKLPEHFPAEPDEDNDILTDDNKDEDNEEEKETAAPAPDKKKTSSVSEKFKQRISILQKIREILTVEFNVDEKITMDTKIDDLNLYDYDGDEFFIAVENEYDVELDPDSIETVADIVKIIMS